MRELLGSPRTPTDPKAYFFEASRRSTKHNNISATADEGSTELTEEPADLIGAHESLSELFIILEVDAPDGEALGVKPPKDPKSI
jgi:hypothetical protein